MLHYLCAVNKQVNYIIYAHLLLASMASVYFIASKIPSTIIEEQSGECGVIDSHYTPLEGKASQGMTLFMSKCASCHRVNGDLTGPALKGFEDRGPWADSSQLYAWIRNPQAFMDTNLYVMELRTRFPSMMQAFPTMTKEDIEAIREYIKAY